MCGGRSGAIWLPSHHPRGCCTLVVVEEISPFYVKCFEYPERRYMNEIIYYHNWKNEEREPYQNVLRIFSGVGSKKYSFIKC